jgi:L,D-peptidoglycan transpeptidase YkuD (ErfK/YbiS/YcfS/YnhG family)
MRLTPPVRGEYGYNRTRHSRAALAAGLGVLLVLLVSGCGAREASVPTSASAPADTGAPASAPVPTATPVAVSAPAGSVRTGLPAGVPAPPAGTDQLVTVLVPTAASTTGVLRAWQRGPGGAWNATLGPVRVRVGAQGIGQAREGLSRTPRGTYSLAQAFGRQPNPGTKLPYRTVGNNDWWVSDPKSAAYNTYRKCAPGSCPFNESAGENLGGAGAAYDYAAVIGYNTAPVRPGAGSAFFMHVDTGKPTAGCVAVPRASEVALLRWLDPARHPQITIGLG